MKKSIFFFFCLLISFVSADELKNNKIKELLKTTNTIDISKQYADQIIVQYKKMFPTVPNEMWDEFAKEITNKDFEALLIKLYDHNYTEKEIDALLTFYSSEEGQSIIKKMPIVLSKSMQIGAMWGKLTAKKIYDKIIAKGYKPVEI
ncbi:hypothetical protein CRV01_07365 [Arcobacter sp. CECT 8983]|uniref:DUF2059 domain-containing protein n=1 Tax=Arcobacter sp. CECT 8983 TaxID=2044508 RepID=UPI00100ABB37|nr:DUF2059 domain-containing protein [Arcobacter sp. CECT 8983]RXJ89686.1 hypothetical protein CRV01_07365 [Arcobacter sp. CECT 8983]